MLGGSAVFFSYAASYFTTVRLVGVVGDDWPAEHTALLQARNIDTAGLQVVAGGKTFRWRGNYLQNMNDRETLDVQLNVLDDFQPVLPERYQPLPSYLFLANGSPRLQLKVLDQCPGATLVVADTMDHYIHTEPRASWRRCFGGSTAWCSTTARPSCSPARRTWCGPASRAARWGPRFVVIKKGEHGAMFFSQHETYVLPAYPTADVVDPTGAGDSFAGGMMGYLAEQGNFEPKTLKEAMAYGILVASFTVEDFSLDRLQQIDRDDLDQPHDRISPHVELLVNVWLLGWQLHCHPRASSATVCPNGYNIAAC